MIARGAVRLLVPSCMLALVACGDAPVAPASQQSKQADPEASQAQNHRACFPVEGHLSSSGFVGVLTGDLEGTSFAFPGPFPEVRFPGNTIHVNGTREWNITGGTVPPLIGASFTTAYSTVLIEQIGEVVRATERDKGSGTTEANVTFHGSTDLTSFPVSISSELDYRGVVCP